MMNKKDRLIYAGVSKKDRLIYAGLWFTILLTLFLLLRANAEPDTNTVPSTIKNISELELLTKLINSESGTENTLDKLMVGSVVLNRMRKSNRSMYDVIYERNAFAGVDTEGFTHSLKSESVARFILKHGPVDTTVMYFLNPKISTNRDWVRKVSKRPLVLKNKNHFFYK